MHAENCAENWSGLSLDLTLIGDGAFLDNPGLGSLGAARDYNLPIMALIFNNKKYAAMQGMHQKMYPDGIAAEIDLYHGTHIKQASSWSGMNPLSSSGIYRARPFSLCLLNLSL